jgi:hypothetical protein
MDRSDTEIELREPSCASKVMRYVVAPTVIALVILNSRDIYKYLRLLAMSAGAGRQREG